VIFLLLHTCSQFLSRSVLSPTAMCRLVVVAILSARAERRRTAVIDDLMGGCLPWPHQLLRAVPWPAAQASAPWLRGCWWCVAWRFWGRSSLRRSVAVLGRCSAGRLRLCWISVVAALATALAAHRRHLFVIAIAFWEGWLTACPDPTCFDLPSPRLHHALCVSRGITGGRDHHRGCCAVGKIERASMGPVL